MSDIMLQYIPVYAQLYKEQLSNSKPWQLTTKPSITQTVTSLPLIVVIHCQQPTFHFLHLRQQKAQLNI